MSDDETMDNNIPVKFNAGGKTCVFWDVEDYPIPDGIDPVSFSWNIKEAIKKRGCHGEVLFRAYVDPKFSSELRRKYEDAGFEFAFQGDKVARSCTMLLDLVLWIDENDPEPTNMIILAKNIPHSIGERLGCLAFRDYGILVSQTDPEWYLPSESSTLFLTSLFDGPCRSSQRTNPREDI